MNYASLFQKLTGWYFQPSGSVAQISSPVNLGFVNRLGYVQVYAGGPGPVPFVDCTTGISYTVKTSDFSYKLTYISIKENKAYGFTGDSNGYILSAIVCDLNGNILSKNTNLLCKGDYIWENNSFYFEYENKIYLIDRTSTLGNNDRTYQVDSQILKSNDWSVYATASGANNESFTAGPQGIYKMVVSSGPGLFLEYYTGVITRLAGQIPYNDPAPFLPMTSTGHCYPPFMCGVFDGSFTFAGVSYMSN